MKWRQYLMFVRSDLYRYGSKSSFWIVFIRNPEFRFVFFLRSAAFLKGKGYLFPLFAIARLVYGRLAIKYGISIPYTASIGPGLYIGHFGGIVVNHEVIIGKNCNINHGVTLGVAYGGKYPGCPKIGDNVFLGTGCVVFGDIFVSNDAAIGSNCVVTESVPISAVVVGVPGTVISTKGSGKYVVNRVA